MSSDCYKLYIMSRGKAPEHDYNWVHLTEAGQEIEQPPDLSRGQINRLIYREAFSLFIGRYAQKLVLQVTGLVVRNQQDFQQRLLRTSLLYIADLACARAQAQEAKEIKGETFADPADMERVFRGIAAFALKGLLKDAEGQLEDMINNAIHLTSEPPGFVVVGNPQQNLMKLGTQVKRGTAKKDTHHKIGKNTEDLIREVIEEISSYDLPTHEGPLVVVTNFVSHEVFEQYNVWRGLSNLIDAVSLTEITVPPIDPPGTFNIALLGPEIPESTKSLHQFDIPFTLKYSCSTEDGAKSTGIFDIGERLLPPLQRTLNSFQAQFPTPKLSKLLQDSRSHLLEGLFSSKRGKEPLSLPDDATYEFDVVYGSVHWPLLHSSIRRFPAHVGSNAPEAIIEHLQKNDVIVIVVDVSTLDVSSEKTAYRIATPSDLESAGLDEMAMQETVTASRLKEHELSLEMKLDDPRLVLFIPVQRTMDDLSLTAKELQEDAIRQAIKKSYAKLFALFGSEAAQEQIVAIITPMQFSREIGSNRAVDVQGDRALPLKYLLLFLFKLHESGKKKQPLNTKIPQGDIKLAVKKLSEGYRQAKDKIEIVQGHHLLGLRDALQ